MNILVTGAKGFVGKNLVATLKATTDYHIYEIDRDSSQTDLKSGLEKADFIVHLAGINRPENNEEFMEGNAYFTQDLLDLAKEVGSKAPILVSSSIQAKLDNPYGKSKKAGEDIIRQYGQENNIPVYIYRLPNLFGKWCRPNYNSVIATFCYNIAHDIEITVNDPNVMLTLAYIDDVVAEFIRAIHGDASCEAGFCYIPVTHEVSLGEIASLIKSFKASRQTRLIPNMADGFTKKLYSTYLSYLAEDDFSYPLMMHEDQRGSFTEFVKSPAGGQVSVNVSKPGITKGDHWHHTKNEKFLVVHGQGVIRFRALDSDHIIEYAVSGDKLEVVDIPVGYTHSIVNTGDTDMVTIMWVNELFNPDVPDTYPLEVEKDEKA